MKYNKLFENLDKKIGDQVTVRRYSLSSMISESYKSLYECEAGTNLYKLLEAHLEDVRKNPTDIDRLSRQLCIMKEIIKLKESKKLNDKDLTLYPRRLLKESVKYVTLDPDKVEKVMRSKKYDDEEVLNMIFDIYGLEDGEDYQIGNGELDFGFRDAEDPQVKKLIRDLGDSIDEAKDEEVKEAPLSADAAKDEIYNTWSYGYGGTPQATKEFTEDDDKIFNKYSIRDENDIDNLSSEDALSCYTEFVNAHVEESDEEDLLEEAELTDEEVDELAKHLSELRKNKNNKMSECDSTKKPVEESKSRKLRKKESISETLQNGKTDSRESVVLDLVFSYLRDKYDDAEFADLCRNKFDMTDEEISSFCSIDESVEDNVKNTGDLVDKKNHDTLEPKKIEESSSWSKINLSEFNKKSASKAFVKTFKKLDGKLHEGTALTRQESISLYKAANSAMTHLSVELEHNPDFLSTFNEATTLLTSDVNKILESMKNGKAPSKKTMKSLAKFSEALLESSVTHPNGKEVSSIDLDKALDHYYGTDRDKDNSKYTTEEKQRAVTYWVEKTDGKTPGELKESDKEGRKYGIYTYDPESGPSPDDTEPVETFTAKSDKEAEDYFNNWKKEYRINHASLGGVRESSNEETEEDEELPSIEDEELPDEDFVGDDEGDIASEESEEFDQEYADARVELHKELMDEHGDTEDVDVQSKIAQDAEEVETLPGITDEQIAEIEDLHGADEETPEEEVPEETPDEDIPEEEPDEDTEESIDPEEDVEITDDELADLKKHLKEMRKNKRPKKEEK